MDNFPNHLVAKIFNRLSLRDALHASYVSRAWHTTLTFYLHYTYNVTRYLSSFPDARGLLNTFRLSGAVISGSRALAYFLPAVRPYIVSSDWDIYVPYPHRPLLHSELIRRGFWNVERMKQDRPNEFWVYDYKDNEGRKVQLVALAEGRAVFDCIMGFHHSVVQNVISGWGCYSMHWKSTFAGWGWMVLRMEDPKFPESKERLVVKWAARAMTLVSWKERDMDECTQPSIFAIYLFGGKVCGEAELRLEELQNELRWSSRLSLVQ